MSWTNDQHEETQTLTKQKNEEEKKTMEQERFNKKEKKRAESFLIFCHFIKLNRKRSDLILKPV